MNNQNNYNLNQPLSQPRQEKPDWLKKAEYASAAAMQGLGMA